MVDVQPLIFRDNRLFIVDQRLLPGREKWIELKNEVDVARAIRDMLIRGAPAIGIVAAFGFYLGFRSLKIKDRKKIKIRLIKISKLLKSTRPTAVNLMWAIDRMLNKALFFLLDKKIDIEYVKRMLEKEAIDILEEDKVVNRKIGMSGSKLISKKANILTHCNAGALAVGGYGTAIGVIRAAFEQGKDITIFVDETRPYLQGSRLTSYELKKYGIRHYVITDNTAGFLMQRGKIDLVITGADRIVRNGDTANKIGTYSIAVLAKENNIPFYIAAPLSTFDLRLKNGNEIPIEERKGDEVLYISGSRIAPDGVKALHYGFDVTPARYITAIITERGIIYPPYMKNIIKTIG